MKVKAKHHFKHPKHGDVKQGDVLDVPDHDASQLQQQGHVEAVDPGAGAAGAADPHKDKPET